MRLSDVRWGAKALRLFSRNLLLCFLVLVISGCINSKLVVTPLYNRIDNQMSSQFNELGDFNQEQKAASNQAIGTFHVWHRQSELPQYALWVRDIAEAIASTEVTTAEDIERWASTLTGHTQRARECYPIYFLLDEVQSLSEKQIDLIEQNFKEEMVEDRERYASRTPEERIERRIKNIDKWAGRIKLDLTPEQLAAIRVSLSQQVSMSEQYYDVVEQWNTQLFLLVRDQKNPDYADLVKAHLGKRWSLLTTAYPDEWQKNRDLWQQTLRELIASLSPAQRKDTSSWLSVFSKTLQEISQDTPSFKPSDDASVGCLVAAVS